MNRKQKLVLAFLTLGVGVSAFSAPPVVWSDTNLAQGWNTLGMSGTLRTNLNQQLVITENFFGATPTNDLLATHVPAAHVLTNFGALRDLQTPELRSILISANQNAAAAMIYDCPQLADAAGFRLLLSVRCPLHR